MVGYKNPTKEIIVSLTRSIGRNTLLQIIGKGIGTVLGLVTVAILQRSLGTEGYGAYTTVMSFMGFFSVIADLGLYLITLREIAKAGADKEKILGNALSLRVVAAFGILVVGIAVSFLFPYASDIRIGIALISASFFFIAIQQLLVSVFQNALRMASVVVGELSGRVVLLALVFWFAQGTATLTNMLIAVVVSSVVNAAVVFIRAKRFIPFRFQVDIEYWKYLLHETWPIAISIVLNLLYFRLDTIFLSVFRPLEEVGLYGAGYKILEILITVPNLFIGLVMPVLSASAFVAWDRFRLVFQKAFDMLLIMALPIVVVGILLAQNIIVFVGGSEYADATHYFQILIFAVLFLFFGALSGHTVTAIHEQRRMVWRYLAVAVLGIALYVVLIPWIGAYGAAIGTVVTECAIMIAGFHMIYKTRNVIPSLKIFGRAGASAAVMGIAVFATRDMHVLASLAIGVIVYAFMLFATKTVDIKLLKNIFRSEAHE